MRAGSSAGLGLGLVSAATFGTSGAFASSLLHAGWTPGAAVTVRVVIAALVLTVPALLALRGRYGGLRRGSRSLLVYGVGAVAGAQLCYFNAVEHLPVAVALLLEYSGVLLVVGWMWMRHGHRPGRLTAAGGVAACFGLVLVLDLLSSHGTEQVGVLWGLGAAVGLALYFVLSSATNDAPSPIVVAWGGLAIGALALLAAGVAGALPFAAPRTNVTLASTRVSWVVPVLGMSIIAAAIAYVTGILGARLLGARVASFVGLTEVVFAVLFAWLLLGQTPRLIQGVGGALVLAGIALVRLDETSEDSASDVKAIHTSGPNLHEVPVGAPWRQPDSPGADGA